MLRCSGSGSWFYGDMGNIQWICIILLGIYGGAENLSLPIDRVIILIGWVWFLIGLFQYNGMI